MSRRKRLTAARGRRSEKSVQARKAWEILEERRLLAAHIVGSTTAYATIQAAVDAALAGQTITVDAGTYPEQVSIFKQLTLQGAQAGVDGRSNVRGTGESILTGANSGGNFTSSFKISANDVVIDGFTVQGENVAATDTGAGIVINPNISGTHIINDIIQNNSTGLYLANASATDATLIQHNAFKNNNNGATDTNNGGRAIYADGATSGGTLQNVTIDGNFFTLNLGTVANPIQAAIGLEGGATSTTTNINITNNVFDHNGKALLALNASHLLIDNNVVGNHYDTGSASYRFEGNDHFVTITHNTMYGNGSQAIRIDAKGTPGADDNFVINNNNIFGNGLEEGNVALMVVAGQYTGTVNAASNWWGTPSGPGGDFSGSGNQVTSQGVPVTITPLLTTYAVNSEIPYHGLANTVTSNINAVDFDFGIDGIGYHDTTSGNGFTQYRPNADVDINTTTDTGIGYDVTNTALGEWMRYSVNVASAGVYTLSARVQSTTAGASFHYEVDGSAVTTSIPIPASASWQTLAQANVSLPSGNHVLRLVFDSNNTGGNAGNWNWFNFALTGTVLPPTAPTGLTATTVPGQINLAWSDATGETGFKIERSADGLTGWTQIGTTTSNVVTYADTTVAANTPYYYRVRATNSAGDSGYSNIANAVSSSTTTSTYIPVGATWKYLDNGTNQGTAWTAGAFDDTLWSSGPAELGYGDGDEATVVSFGPNSNAKYITTYFRKSFTVIDPSVVTALNLTLLRDDGAVVYLNGTEIVRSNIPAGTISYTTLASTNLNAPEESTFYPSAVNPGLLVAGTNVIAVEVHQSVATSSDLSFNFSLAATITQPSAPPTAPSNLVATAASYQQINLTWADNSSNETGFILERSSDGTTNWTQIATPGINVTSYSDSTGLSALTPYYYRIRASNSAGASANSAVATATTLAAPILPMAPTNLAAGAISSSQIVLNWRDASADETSFIIERSPNGTAWTQIGTAVANATSYTDSTGLAASTQYFYRVHSANAAGASAASNVATATTTAAVSWPAPWTDGDIGTVGATGSGSYASGVYTINGAGADIWNAADAMNFASVPLNGDGSITAQVTSLTNTEQWAKAGVMIRESRTAGASEASMVITPSNGSVFIDRLTTGGASDGTFNIGAAPYWVRLVRSGTLFTASVSPDGSAWTVVGTQTIAMGTSTLIGLGVASRTTGLATATFANVTITGVLPATPGPIAISPVSGTQINLAWADVSGEAGFKIERSTDNLIFAQIGATTAGITSFTDNNATGSTLYYYRVKATNATGDSAPSAVVSSQSLQPPTAPSNLAGTPVANSLQINLTWTDNATTETGFIVERSPDGTTNWTQVGAPAANATSFSDTAAGITAGTTYYYRVRATNAIGASTNSNVAPVTATPPPTAPTNLLATPSASALQIALTWTDNSGNEDGFIIERSPDGTTNWTQIATPAINATSYADNTGLAVNTTYYYRVRATNSILGPSLNSAVASAKTAAPPLAPTSLAATPAANALQVNLTWTDNSAIEDGFVIERSPNGTDTWTQVGTAVVNATSFSDTSAGLSLGTIYYYRVRATNAVLGNSNNSNVASATTANVPAAPGSLVATPATNALQISLTWVDNSTNEDGFIIERSPNGTDTWMQVGTAAANATAFSDTSAGLAIDTTYFYRVRATDSVLGPSINSNIASAKTAAPPAAPSGLIATPATTTLKIDLTWTDNSSIESGFVIERSPDGTTAWTQVGTVSANVTTFSDTSAGLALHTAYFYRARATNSVLGPSANSAVATATTASTPAAPGNLLATATASAVQINLTWTDNAGNEDGYVVERSPNGTDTWIQIATLAADATSYSDTDINLAMNTAYFYRVRAASTALGASANSNVASATTAALPIAPGTLVATPAANALQINLAWADNSSNETGFILERSPNGVDTWTQIATPAANATSYIDASAPLALGTTYYYRIRAVDALGPSNNSNIASATTATTPANPGNLVATAAVNAIQINLTWTDNSTTEDGFVIERSPNGADTWTQVGSVAANATAFNDSTAGLTANTAFYYRVRATDSVLGPSGNSSVASAKTAAPPAAPGNVVATASSTLFQISLTWTDNSSTEEGFVVERSPNGVDTWTQVGAPAINATSFTDSTPGLAVGTTYYYRVRAINTPVGNSDYSNVAIATTASPPSAPSNLVASASTTALQIGLIWTDNSSIEDGYIVERSPNGSSSWTQVGSLAANATSFSDTTTGLAVNSTFYYRVRATNSVLGPSPDSNIAPATIIAAPLAPSNLVATASTSALQIALTWTDNATNEDGFVIERSLSGANTWTQVGTAAANATSFTDSTGSLAVGTAYDYRVRATSATFGVSANSNIATATTASAPAAPTLLAATAESNVLQIDLTWTDNASTENSYVVERSPNGTDGWTQVGVLGVNAARFSDTSASLTTNTTYYYRVRAVSIALGESANSNIASATTAPAPTAPGNLVATPSTVAIEIDLTWADNSSDESGFVVERSANGTSGWTQIATTAANATTYADTSGALVTNTTYYYRVYAANSVLGPSGDSNVASAKTAGAPVAPSNLVAAASSSLVQITLTWTDNSNNENGFIVERSLNGTSGWTPIGTSLANTMSFTDPNTLSSGVTYYYRIRASNDFGSSASSNVSSATTASAPVAPSSLIATPVANGLQINLTWNDNSGNESGFIVERSPNGTDTWTQVGTPAANATTFSDSTGLSAGTAYYYRIRATNTFGASGNSNVATATTAIKPAAPGNLVATAATNSVQINLTWTDNSSNETGFIVERSPNGTDTWTQVGTPAANATSFTDSTGLSAGTTYYYRVSAINGVGASSVSNVSSALTVSTPTAPTNLVATASVSTLQITLTWLDNSNNETGFILERSLNGVDTWTPVGTPAPNATTLTDSTALSAGVTYYYRIRAVDDFGPSANSNIASATTVSAPNVPTNLVATPAPGDLEIDLTWTDNSANETGFVIERSPNGTDSWTQIATPAVNATSYHDIASLAESTPYFYRIRATNAFGSSANSTVASATTPTKPAAPGNLVATAATSGLQINLTWTDNAYNEAGYIVERSLNGVNTWIPVGTPSADATSFSDSTNLSAGVTYYYRVRASNDLGSSANSNVASATTPSAPQAPSSLTAAPATSSLEIDLTWTDNASNETGFIVERSPNGTDSWTQIGTPAANATSFADTTGLAQGATYYYRVRATNDIGPSANSNIASATAASTPSAPSNLVATAATSSLEIDLTWTDNATNEAGFIVERSLNGLNTWIPVGTPAPDATSFVDTAGLSAGVTYYYRVRASNDFGSSANSNVASATAASAPAAPTNLNATPAPGSLEIDLTWTDNASNETGFIVERSPNGTDSWTQIGTPATDATSFSDTTGLSEGTAYYYRVRAVGTVGNSDNSNIASATTISTPAAPSDLAATGLSTTQIHLSWTDNADNETGFVIERSANGADGWTQVGATVADATAFDDTITPGAPYYYRVRATGGLDSANTAVAHSWALAGVPSTPTPSGVTLNAEPTTLDWADAPNATSYDVYWGSSDTFLGNVTTSEFTGVIPPAAEGTQTWRVVAKNGDNSTNGPAWTFTVDTTPPTATLGAQTPTPGASTFDFTITYGDATSGVDTATFDDNDITVTGPNSFSANATFVSAVGNVATYRINAPGAAWNGNNDGMYTVSENAGQVKDLAGNAVAAASVGAFNATSFAYMTGTTLIVQFAGANSPITLSNTASTITVSGGSTSLNFDGVTDIQVIGTAADNTLQIDGTITPAITFTGSSGNATVHVMSGSAIFASDLSPALHNVTVIIDSSAAATFNSSQHLAGLVVSGIATFATGGNKVLRTTNLSVNGQLNLNDNAMIIDFSIATPYGDISALVQSGRSGGTWTGNGIITGMNAAAGTNPLATLAVANASDALGIDESGVWNGETVTPSSKLVRYTYVGDANLDGIINGDDYFFIDQGYASQSTGYTNGDFDGNGRIDADDYFIIDSHYGKAQTPLATPPASPLAAGLTIQAKTPASDATAAAAVNVPSTINTASLFSSTTIASAYDRLHESDELI